MTLYVHEWGPRDAPRVICLHGVTSHGRHFARFAQALPELHVVAPDLLGHGFSPYEPPWRIDDHLEALVEAIGLEPAALVGHSFGARLAFELAAQHPGVASQLVLLDPAILIPPHIALVAAENARKDRSYVSFEEGIERRFDESQLHRAPRDLLVEELAVHLVPDDDGRHRYRYCQSSVVVAYGEMATQPPPFESVRVPTLLVLGERSYVPYDHLLDAHRSALGHLLEVRVLPGGHTVLWDALEETIEAVAGFLRRDLAAEASPAGA